MSTSIDRRAFLMGAGGAAGIGSSPTDASEKGEHGNGAKRSEFLWGSAGAAYQIEGGNVASDLWVLEHVKPSVFKEPSGDATDSYHRYEDDLTIAQSLGFNVHRLSIEWSRIEPELGLISRAAVDYYRRVLEAVRRRGMKTFVTFHHFTSPRWFAAAGGFSEQQGIEPFVRYCRTVAENLGDLIDFAATFNEPNLPAQMSWWSGPFTKLRPVILASSRAAAAAEGSKKWAVALFDDWSVQQPIMIEAHNQAYEAIRAATNGRIPVGVTLSLQDERSAEGSAGAEKKRSQAWDPWLKAKGDFVGIQTYTYTIVGNDADLPPPEGVELTQIGYPFAPEALEAVIRAVAARTRRPIYVTENGVATEDDARRIAFINSAVKGVFNCMREGIDVRGYIHWSLLDNWEWFFGFGPKFGLVSVDRQSFGRTPKPSAQHLGQIARIGLPAYLT